MNKNFEILSEPLVLSLLVIIVALISFFLGNIFALFFIGILGLLNKDTFWLLLILGFIFGAFRF